MTLSLKDTTTSPYIDRRDVKTRTWRRRPIFDVMQVRCLNLQRIRLLSAKWPQLLGNRRTNSYKSAGIRWWVSWAEHTWENQSKYDGRCTVCLRDVPRLLSLTLCPIIDHQQPCNPPKGHRAEFRPPRYREMKPETI